MSKKTTARQRLVWRKLSPAKWEDVWQERLSWLGPRLVIFVLAGMKTLRLEAHQLSRVEAKSLTRQFGGVVRVAKHLSRRDLEPKPRPPLRVRGRLCVVGSARDRAAEMRNGTPTLFIPASLAFGTGEHATTATCLRMLADLSKKQAASWEALDLGTGSGILALAARLLGARRVEAGDFDPTAVRVARENAATNQVKGVVFRRFDVTKWRPAKAWPVVMANVYGPILIEAASQIAMAVAPRGHLVLSGILREQSAGVVAAFRAQGLRFEKITRRGKWVTCLAARK
jgi:ribosomal protein L11 methyltransferase